ncbi:MAG: hypothetical protein EP317_03810 [Bacillota bacterium]|nr:MAG: hypothetical protein EP317_03810 [Bacillota bacterium]
MKLKDTLWLFVLIIITGFVISPLTKEIFTDLTSRFPYMMGFMKTAILASMGEMLVSRIRTKNYFSYHGIILKAFVWGLLGMVFVVIFKLFASGVVAAQGALLLPSIAGDNFLSKLLTAFLISLFMNVFFAPTFMLFHRITDGYIELGEGSIKKITKVKLNHVIDRIDFKSFVGFVVLKTIPLFWIPAHTITFLLPETYRILMAAYLSIVLGFILTISKSRKVLTHES